MAKIQTSKIPTVGENFVLTFGKNKGQTLAEILKYDPGYILWLDENITAFKIEKYIIQAAEENDDYNDELFNGMEF